MINKFENFLLISTAIGLSVIGLGYGINPNFYPEIFGYEIENNNGFHVFKAFNGLYLIFAGFWILSIFIPKIKQSAILSIIVLMLGLIVGRIWSLFVEGIPHFLLLSFLGLEFFVLFQAVLVYRKKYF